MRKSSGIAAQVPGYSLTVDGGNGMQVKVENSQTASVTINNTYFRNTEEKPSSNGGNSGTTENSGNSGSTENPGSGNSGNTENSSSNPSSEVKPTKTTPVQKAQNSGWNGACGGESGRLWRSWSGTRKEWQCHERRKRSNRRQLPYDGMACFGGDLGCPAGDICGV